MSEKNGDKARFGRERRGKVRRRKQARALRKSLEAKQPAVPKAATPGS